jgi:hypothetical protein
VTAKSPDLPPYLLIDKSHERFDAIKDQSVDADFLFHYIIMADEVRKLVAQYFQLVDPPQLDLPPGNVLLRPAVQEALYERMFDDSLTPLPPSAYRTRILKLIIARIEESITDPEEDVCMRFDLLPMSNWQDFWVIYLINYHPISPHSFSGPC